MHVHAHWEHFRSTFSANCKYLIQVISYGHHAVDVVSRTYPSYKWTPSPWPVCFFLDATYKWDHTVFDFCVQLFPFSKASSSFIHVITNISIFSLNFLTYLLYIIFGLTGSLMLNTGFLLLQSKAPSEQPQESAAHVFSFPKACGVFPDQGSNLGPLNWQVDSQPPNHQEGPDFLLFWCWIVFHCIHIYHIFFVHSSVDRHSGCFHILTTMNNTAMNTGV